jgi:hypothetical protein
VILREVLVDDGAELTELPEHGVRSVLPVEGVDRGDLVRLDPRDVLVRPGDLADLGADVRRHLDPRGLRRRVAGGSNERREAVLRGDDIVGLDLLLDRPAIRLLHPVRQHGDERDERQSDHQRRRRCRGSPGIPERVTAGEEPRHARELFARNAHDGGEGTHELGRDHRDTHEEQEDAAGDRQQPLAGIHLLGEHRLPEEDER